jgi:hypothetical protein
MELFSVEEIMQNESSDIRFITQIIQNGRKEVSVLAEVDRSGPGQIVNADQEEQAESTVNDSEPEQMVHLYQGEQAEGTGQGDSADGTDAHDTGDGIDWDADYLDIAKYLISIMDRSNYKIYLANVRIEHSSRIQEHLRLKNIMYLGQGKSLKHFRRYLGDHLARQVRRVIRRAPFVLGFNGDWGFSYWIFCSFARFRQVRLLSKRFGLS